MFSCPCVGFFVTVALAAISSAPPQQQDHERVIRNMVDQALSRLNRGDLAALDEFWDEGADYVGVALALIAAEASGVIEWCWTSANGFDRANSFHPARCGNR